LQAVAALGSVHLVTTEEVLVAFLSAYAGRDAYLRQEALKTIRATLDNAHVTVARAQSRTLSPQSLDDLRREAGLGESA
jgi:hypothetical protein